MKPDPESTCPYTGHKDKCMKHFLNCPKWIQIQGYDANSGKDMNEWRCADAWMPFLTIENSQMQRQTGAAVESFRNLVSNVIPNPQIKSNGKDNTKVIESKDADTRTG